MNKPDLVQELMELLRDSGCRVERIGPHSFDIGSGAGQFTTGAGANERDGYLRVFEATHPGARDTARGEGKVSAGEGRCARSARLAQCVETALTITLRASSRKEAGVGLFTINFELGDKTLETLTRITNTSVIRFELGPETRAMIERLATPKNGDEKTVGRLVKKGADALRSG